MDMGTWRKNSQKLNVTNLSRQSQDNHFHISKNEGCEGFGICVCWA